MRIRQEYQKLSAKRELDVNLGKFSYIEAFFFYLISCNFLYLFLSSGSRALKLSSCSL